MASERKYTRKFPREYATDLCELNDEIYMTGWADGHGNDNDAFLLKANPQSSSPILYFGLDFEVEGKCILPLDTETGDDEDPQGFVIGGATNYDHSGSIRVTSNAHVFRTDMHGNILWSTVLGHRGSHPEAASYDYIHDMDLDHEGHVLVAGTYNGAYDAGNGSAYATLYVARLNRLTGRLMWAKKIGRGNERSRDDGGIHPQGIRALATGGMIVSGFMRNKREDGTEVFDALIMKLNPYGHIEWQYIYPNLRTNLNTAIRQAVIGDDGHLVAVGGNMRDAGHTDLILISGHLDAFASGNPPAATVFGCPESVNGYDIDRTEDGNVLVCGFYGTEIDRDARRVFMGKFTDKLEVTWMQYYGGSRTPPRVLVRGEEYFASGSVVAPPPASEVYLIHTDHFGQTGCETPFSVCKIDHIQGQIVDLGCEDDTHEDELELQTKAGKLHCESLCDPTIRG